MITDSTSQTVHHSTSKHRPVEKLDKCNPLIFLGTVPPLKLYYTSTQVFLKLGLEKFSPMKLYDKNPEVCVHVSFRKSG